MDSTQFDVEWFAWDTAVSRAPTKAGVFLRRSRTRWPEIMYIGKAANGEGLRQRLTQYQDRAATDRAKKRIRDLVEADGSIEVACIVDERAAERAAELLATYLHSHGELPAWNEPEGSEQRSS